MNSPSDPSAGLQRHPRGTVAQADVQKTLGSPHRPWSLELCRSPEPLEGLTTDRRTRQDPARAPGGPHGGPRVSSAALCHHWRAVLQRALTPSFTGQGPGPGGSHRGGAECRPDFQTADRPCVPRVKLGTLSEHHMCADLLTRTLHAGIHRQAPLSHLPAGGNGQSRDTLSALLLCVPRPHCSAQQVRLGFPSSTAGAL